MIKIDKSKIKKTKVDFRTKESGDYTYERAGVLNYTQSEFFENKGILKSDFSSGVESRASNVFQGFNDYFETPLSEIFQRDTLTDEIIKKFKSHSLKENFYELKWQSYDPEIIINFLIAVAEIISNITFFEYQRHFLKRVFRSIILREGADIVGLWSRQSGKTQTMSIAIITLSIMMPLLGKLFPELSDFSRGFSSGIFAPTEKQSKISYNRIKMIAKSKTCLDFISDPLINVSYSGEGLKWDNGSIVFYGSAKMTSNIEGDTAHLLYVDEAQDIDEETMDYKIDPMRAFTNGTLVLTGLPSKNKYFYKKYVEANVKSNFVNEDKKYLFKYDYKVVSKYNNFYKTFVSSKLKSKGETSFYFRRNFLLDWDLFDLNVRAFDVNLFIKNCAKDYLDFGDYNDGFVLGGIDIAYAGTTVFTIGEVISVDRKNQDFLYKESVLKILGIYVYENITATALQDKIVDVLNSYNEDKIFMITIDSTGGGHYFVDTMKRRFSNLGSKLRGLSVNKTIKIDLTTIFMDLVHNKKIYFPASEKSRNLSVWNNLISQLTNVDLVESNEGIYFNSENKKINPDDFVDSMLLLVNSFYHYEKTRLSGFFDVQKVSLKENPAYQKGFSKFKYTFPYEKPSSLESGIKKLFPTGSRQNNMIINRFNSLTVKINDQ